LFTACSRSVFAHLLVLLSHPVPSMLIALVFVSQSPKNQTLNINASI